jgi:hypothetical protein
MEEFVRAEEEQTPICEWDCDGDCDGDRDRDEENEK